MRRMPRRATASGKQQTPELSEVIQTGRSGIYNGAPTGGVQCTSGTVVILINAFISHTNRVARGRSIDLANMYATQGSHGKQTELGIYCIELHRERLAIIAPRRRKDS